MNAMTAIHGSTKEVPPDTRPPARQVANQIALTTTPFVAAFPVYCVLVGVTSDALTDVIRRV